MSVSLLMHLYASGKVYKSCFVGLRELQRIRQYLPKTLAVSAANTLVSSRLDYCNSLYQCLSKSNLIRLQCLQNVLVRVVMGSCKWTHITPVLKSLHWLSVKERITFKTATLIYKHLDSGLLQYFHEYINYFTHFVNTRCAVATKKY